jgi:hypothetical protein
MSQTVKSKGKFVPTHAMKNYRGSGGNLLSFLISAADGGAWSFSSPGGFTPGKEPLYSCPYKIKCKK